MEQSKISLSQIGLYNPQRVNDENAENLFIARRKVFNFLMEKLNHENPNSIPQHHLIIAQRGMGKSTLLKRIEVELRKKEWKEKFVPFLFSEEQYNLKNLAEFWLNSLDALADTLELESNAIATADIDTKVRELSKITNDDDLAREAYQFLKRMTSSIKRRPVMLVDNMSLIFDRLSNEEQYKLRGWLTQEGSPILIGASTVSIDATTDYGAAFYDAFQIQHLKKLAFDELIEVLNNLAVLTHTPELIPILHKEIGRIKTLHSLTGGNPRTAVMLFKLIVKGFAKEINDDLEALLDEITPLYKSRFEELAPQMQVIIDAVALHWAPININQLRRSTRLENNQLSPQIKRLLELGWIEKIAAYHAKGNAYEISERFFNIWFLMRRSSRRKKKELYCLSKFLESLYGEDLDEMAKKRLDKQSENIDHSTADLALGEVVKDKMLGRQLKEKAYSSLREFAKDDPKVLEQFDIPKSALEKKISKLYKQHDKEIEFKNFEKAEKILLKLKELTLHDKKLQSRVLFKMGSLEDVYLLNYDMAFDLYEKAIELDATFARPWNNLGNLYANHFKKYDDAEEAYKKAIELDQSLAITWNNLSVLYEYSLKNIPEAVKGYEKAIQLGGSKYSFLWERISNLCFYKIHDYEKAAHAYEQAIAFDKKAFNEWNHLGNIYRDYLYEYDKAEQAYKEDKGTRAQYNLIYLYRDKMNKQQEAEDLFNSLQMDLENTDTHFINKCLFSLYHKNEGQALNYLRAALQHINNGFTSFTEEDWWHLGAVTSQLDYGLWLANSLEEGGYDIKLAPYYVAIKAMTEKDSSAYLNSKALEIREPAKKIMETIIRFKAV